MGLGLYLSGKLDAISLSLGAERSFKFAPSMFASDRDCSDFKTRAEAQAFFRQAGPGDPHHLDEDGDGLACEFNPWFDWFSR